MAKYKATIEAALTWESQFVQYPAIGDPGISYFAGDVSESHPDKPPIHCLLYRAPRGILVGILNYYEVDYPPHEKAGNVNLFVKPNQQRKGIGTALVQEARFRWPHLTGHNQRFTREGALFLESFEKEHDGQDQ